MIKTRKSVLILLLILCMAFLLTGCAEEYPDYLYYPPGHGFDRSGYLILATSFEDTGLLNSLLASFTAETGRKVMVMPVSNSAAFELGRNGDADILFTNAYAFEWQFVNDGYAEALHTVLSNNLIIVGPADGVIFPNNDVLNTFEQILFFNMPFVSRGDGSSLHLRELQLWRGFYLNHFMNQFYIESFASARGALYRAVEENAFSLTDTASWLAFADRGNLVVICDEDFRLDNFFNALAVSSSPMLEGADEFVTWLTSDSAQEIIRHHGTTEHGVSLFNPAN